MIIYLLMYFDVTICRFLCSVANARLSGRLPQSKNTSVCSREKIIR